MNIYCFKYIIIFTQIDKKIQWLLYKTPKKHALSLCDLEQNSSYGFLIYAYVQISYVLQIL